MTIQLKRNKNCSEPISNEQMRHGYSRQDSVRFWCSSSSMRRYADLFSPPFLISCACGQIPFAKSNGAGNWRGCETIWNVGSEGADGQWLCDIPSPAQCASHNWKAFVIWLPFDYDVQDVNPNRTSVTAAEEHAHIAFPGFTSQFKCAWLLVSSKQYLTVPLLTLVG